MKALVLFSGGQDSAVCLAWALTHALGCETLVDIVAGGFDAATVRQVYAWIDENEYKRRQAPPGIKITPRAFGRDRRYPITNRYRPQPPTGPVPPQPTPR